MDRVDLAITGLLSSLDTFFKDPLITDIIINSDNTTWIEKEGKMYKVDALVDPKKLITLGTLLASKFNKEANEKRPSVAATLPLSNMRIQVLLPPIVDSPSISIRRPSSKIFTFDELLEFKCINKNQIKFIKKAINEKDNIILAGGTGSGKTTLLNTILQNLPIEDRLHIIEDVRELQAPNPNKNNVLTNDYYLPIMAVKDSLRCRIDRVIFGELRDGETALELLKAWNTGHPGGITTIHANSAKDVFLRLSQLIAEVSISNQEELINQVCNLVLFMRRNGAKRELTQVIYKGEEIC